MAPVVGFLLLGVLWAEAEVVAASPAAFVLVQSSTHLASPRPENCDSAEVPPEQPLTCPAFRISSHPSHVSVTVLMLDPYHLLLLLAATPGCAAYSLIPSPYIPHGFHQYIVKYTSDPNDSAAHSSSSPITCCTGQTCLA